MEEQEVILCEGNPVDITQTTDDMEGNVIQTVILTLSNEQTETIELD